MANTQAQRELDHAFEGQNELTSAEEERRQVWIKLQSLRDTYQTEMTALCRMLTARSNHPMAAEQLQKLKHYKDVLHRMLPYLRVSQDRVPRDFNLGKVEAFEEQIVNIMETFQRRRLRAA